MSKDVEARISARRVASNKRLDTPIGVAGFGRVIAAALAAKAIRLTGIPEDSLIEARRMRRKETPAGRGKHHCSRCGFRIRGSITRHEAGLHHQAGQGTHKDSSGEVHSSKGRCSIKRGKY